MGRMGRPHPTRSLRDITWGLHSARCSAQGLGQGKTECPDPDSAPKSSLIHPLELEANRPITATNGPIHVPSMRC